MAQDIQIKINAAVESAEAAKSLGQLRKSLEELQKLADEADLGSEQFSQLQQQITSTNAKMAEAKDRIGDIQDKISTLEGTPVERISNSFGLLKQAIFNLDVDKAKVGIEGLVNAFTPLGPNGAPLKGLAALRGTLGGVTSAVGTLGTSFIQLGRALLTNPLFLLATVIAGIVVAIVALLNKLGLIKPIMDAIGAAVEFVTDAFNNLTEAIGLNTAASDKHLERVSENYAKEREAIQETYNLQVSIAQSVRGLNSIQIADIQKVTGFYLQQGQTVETSEKRKQEALMKTYKQEIQQYKDIEAANGKLNDDQKKKLSELVKAHDEAALQIINIERGRISSIQQIERQNEQAKIDAIQDNVKRAEAQANLDKKYANQSRDQIATLLQEEKKLRADAVLAQGKDQDKLLKEAELRRREINALTQQRQLQENKANSDLQKAQNEAFKKSQQERTAAEAKRVEDAKKRVKEELQNLTDLLDIAVLKTKEGSRERLDAEVDRIEKVQAFTEENAIALEKRQNELDLTRLQSAEKVDKLRESFAQKEAERDFNKLETLKQIEILSQTSKIFDFRVEVQRLEKQKELEQFYLEENLKSNKFTEEQKFKLKLESTAKLEALDNQIFETYEKQLDILSNNYKDSLERFERFKNKELETTLTVDEKKYEIVKKYSKLELDELEFKRKFERYVAEQRYNTEVEDAEKRAENEFLLKLELKSIDRQYNKERVELEKKSSDEIKAIRQEEFDTVTNLSTSGINAVQGLSDAVFAIKMRNLKKGSKEEEKAARQQFNINKALQVGLAVIDGFKAANASLAQSPIAIGPVPNPAGIASLAFSITTSAANIAKILAQKFQPSGGGVGGGEPAGGNVPTISGAAPQAAQFTAPTFFGLGQASPQTQLGPLQQRVYVVETDITAAQNRVAVIENRALIE